MPFKFINHLPNYFNFVTRTMHYTENGIQLRLLYKFRLNSDTFERLNRVFKTVNEYVDEMTKFDSLTFHNYQNLFLVYCFVYFLISIVFLIDQCMNMIKKS